MRKIGALLENPGAGPRRPRTRGPQGANESQVNRTEAGRFDFKASGPPAASLEEPDEARTIRGRDLSGVVASTAVKQRDRIGKPSNVDDVVQNACLKIGKSDEFDRIPLAPSASCPGP